MAQNRADYIWSNIMKARDHGGVSLWRARLITESWKETDGKPNAIRRGLAMKHILENIPLYLDDQQLLCGSYATRSMWAEWYPEYECKFLLNAADDEPALKNFDKGAADPAEIRAIAEYWKDKAMEDQFKNYIDPEEQELLELIGDDNAFIYPWNSNRARHGGYYCVDMAKAINVGYRGIIEEMDAELAHLHIHDHDSMRKAINLKAWKYALEGGIAYGKRCAQMCRDLAEKETDAKRKAELLEMAEVCTNVPENPARNFHEALQTVIFVQIFIYLEMRGDGVSPGRADQYLYPLYKKDMDAGIIDKEKAIELLQCFRIKFNTFRQLASKRFFLGTSGEAQFHNITLGGTDAKGNSAVNELSYLFLEAALKLQTPHPTLSVRYFDDIPADFMDLAIQVVAQGGGYPAFFNDKNCIPCLEGYGVPEEDANQYAIGGCVLAQVPGKTGPGYPVVINLSKCLELALHDGYDYFKCKRQVGPHTGKFKDFKTYEDFYKAFQEQVMWASEHATRMTNVQRCIREYQMPACFTETLLDDCIKTGKMSTGDGPRYQLQYHNARCAMNAINALVAVKKCVFEDKTVDQNTLEDVLNANYEGYEDVRQLLYNAPKYGNDDDYADTIAHDVYRWWCDFVKTMDAGFGDHYIPGAYTVGGHTTTGYSTGALPDGRFGGESLADGSMSPTQGTDCCGPTAVLNSANKIDQSDMSSTLLNMKFQASTLKTPEERALLAGLIATYFDGCGKHVQFNVVDRATLFDAQEHPEDHRDLLVRVAGYSAFFVELLPNLQNEIIKRTENDL